MTWMLCYSASKVSSNPGFWERNQNNWQVSLNTFCIVIVVQSPSRVWLFGTPWTAARQASLSFTISWSLPKFMSIAAVMWSSHLILWRPLLLLSSIFPSIKDFSTESAVLIRWPKYWSFSPSNEYSGVISFRIDWFDLAVQGTLRSLLQNHVKWGLDCGTVDRFFFVLVG